MTIRITRARAQVVHVETSRKLRAQWSIEISEDITAFHDIGYVYAPYIPLIQSPTLFVASADEISDKEI